MKAMSQTKRAANKPLNRVRDLGTATKILITGNGTSAVVGRIQKDIDSFLDDLEAFDAALWNKLLTSTETLGHDAKLGAQTLRRKADTARRRAEDAADN
jgi:hypothetical protein